jgi:hypothetical protein
MDDVPTISLQENPGAARSNVVSHPQAWKGGKPEVVTATPENNMAALFMQKRVKKFLVRRKFQCLTLSDIQEEVDIIEKLDEGFAGEFL